MSKVTKHNNSTIECPSWCAGHSVDSDNSVFHWSANVKSGLDDMTMRLVQTTGSVDPTDDTEPIIMTDHNFEWTLTQAPIAAKSFSSAVLRLLRTANSGESSHEGTELLTG